MAFKDIEKKKAYLKQYRAEHKDEIATLALDYSQSEHGKRINRKNQWMRKYGLTEDQFYAMYNTQGGVCAICKKQEKHKSNGKEIRMLSIDHDHKTGKIRGLLCHSCNSLLGYAEDNKTVLLEAVNYLEAHRK